MSRKFYIIKVIRSNWVINLKIYLYIIDMFLRKYYYPFSASHIWKLRIHLNSRWSFCRMKLRLNHYWECNILNLPIWLCNILQFLLSSLLFKRLGRFQSLSHWSLKYIFRMLCDEKLFCTIKFIQIRSQTLVFFVYVKTFNL